MSVSTDQPIDEDLRRRARLLRQRATSLRSQAAQLSAPLATAYRRRASELELEAWVADVQAGSPDTLPSPTVEDTATATGTRVLHPAA